MNALACRLKAASVIRVCSWALASGFLGADVATNEARLANGPGANLRKSEMTGMLPGQTGCNRGVVVALRSDKTLLLRRIGEVLASINHLPPELLINIWKNALYYGTGHFKELRAIRLTCSSWADIIGDDPTFWTVLHCSDTRPEVQMALQRSRDLPLEVHFPCREVQVPCCSKHYDDGPDSHPEHNEFITLLRTSSRALHRLDIQPFWEDWHNDEFEELLLAHTSKISVLEINSENENGFYKSELIVTSDIFEEPSCTLTVLDMACCRLPSEYPLFPYLHSITLRKCIISTTDLLQVIAGSKSLHTLSVTECETGRLIVPPTTIIPTQLRHIIIEGNRVGSASGTIGLANLVDYISAPLVDVFRITRDAGAVQDMESLYGWLEQYSKRHVSSTRHVGIWVSSYSGEMSVNLGPDFNIRVALDPSSNMATLTLKAVDRIHSSTRPSITSLDLNIADSQLEITLPTLTSYFPAVEELTLHCSAPLACAFLMESNVNEYSSSWPFMELSQLRFDWFGGGDAEEASLLDLVRARRLEGSNRPEGGPRALGYIFFSLATVSKVLLDSLGELGVEVELGDQVKVV